MNLDRPRPSHLEDGYEDWKRFGFDTIGVKAVSEQGKVVVLALCADDSAAARKGLQKYEDLGSSH